MINETLDLCDSNPSIPRREVYRLIKGSLPECIRLWAVQPGDLVYYEDGGVRAPGLWRVMGRPYRASMDPARPRSHGVLLQDLIEGRFTWTVLVEEVPCHDDLA